MTSENATTAGLFADRAVLAPEYVPDRLVGREEELANVEYALNPMIFGREPDDMLIHGPPGVGKTACAKYSARRQTQYASEQGLAAGWAYVDCLYTSTAAGVARTVATQFNEREETGVEVPDSGLSTGEYLDRLRAVLDARYDAAVITLDRVDHLGGDVGTVVDGGTDPAQCVVSHICIVDDETGGDTGEPDDPVRGALGTTEQSFDRYDAEDLTGILRDRRDAFVEGALERRTLDRAAELAAGDAMKAIATLRVAGERVREGGGTTVGPADVAAATDRVDHIRLRDTLSALSEHSRLVVRALADLSREHGPGAFRTARVYDAYAERCREQGRRPRTDRRVLDFLGEHARLGVTEQRSHWGGRGDGNYKTHRLTKPPATVFRALG